MNWPCSVSRVLEAHHLHYDTDQFSIQSLAGRFDCPMSTPQQVVELFHQLSPSDRASVVQVISSELTGDVPGIESQLQVCGGDPCIIRTRIPVWLLVQAQRSGLSEADILRNYPTLRAADLVHAWSYALRHSEAIDRQIAEHEAA